MKNLRLIIFLVVGLAQLAVPASVVWRRTQTLKNGKVWKFRTAPVDPEDAFRGRYVSLQFAAEDVPRNERLTTSESYATLKEGPEGFAEIESLSPTPVSGDNVLKVKTTSWWNNVQHVEFPFDRYWVNEKQAPEAEAAYFANSNRKKMNAYVTVRIRAGDAAIEELYLDNKPLKEYLRGQAKP
jgi:uncharacterized membrane-anchored protein